MIEIGYINKMQVLRLTEHGAYLNGEDLGEILLPKKFLTSEIKPGSEVEAFIYFDSEDRLTATIQHPYTQINKFAYLECVQVSKNGAFLYWGLDKDLLVPKSEQKDKFVKGKKYFVYVYFDEPTDLGFRVIVDNAHWGMIYKSELFRNVKPGDYTYAYVKKVREDMRIDMMLEKSSVKIVDSLEQEILQRIKDNGGALALNDKSSPEEIFEEFGVSKKIFKKAVGGLYKSRLITVSDQGLKMV